MIYRLSDYKFIPFENDFITKTFITMFDALFGEMKYTIFNLITFVTSALK